VLRAAGRKDVRLEEIAGADFERPAAIPGNSELANETARSVCVTMRPWVEALEEFVREVRR
jgi:dTDP-4-dehydrorhamnose reductase